ncbi:MAG TPA: penicillin-binding transpeptidase domain-containing protein [Pirellulales bacterium]|jgi:penicillin-binding protein 2|nr:penicillin-binding transpeptidase domain-containing protein [Pirellulales bacterium]
MKIEPAAGQLSPAMLRNRLRWMLAIIVMLFLTVYVRLIALEVRDGAEYRAMATEPTVRRQTSPGMRGRILARDGTVLACDEPVVNLAVNYRWLEEPADPRWLVRTVRARLSSAQRRDKQLVAEETERFLAERKELWARLAALCGWTESQWQAQRERVQQQVEAISASVNARHQNGSGVKPRAARMEDANVDTPTGVLSLVGRSIADAFFSWDDIASPPPVTVSEELTEHLVFEGLPLDAVAEIETHPLNYPGVKLIHSYRRTYPQGALAAHTVGYLGHPKAEEIAKSSGRQPRPGYLAEHDGESPDAYQPDDWLGRAGIERQYEAVLRGRRGLTTEQLDGQGRIINSSVVYQPKCGEDVVLTIDPALQRGAQTLLDEALNRRLPCGNEQVDAAAGGALVAIDVHTGAVLAAASAPRFDPNRFQLRDNKTIEGWLNDPTRPLLDRSVQMALPPGSVFKIVSAAALLAAGVDPQAPLECQGYLHQPDVLRCAVYRRYGIGHGPVTMVDALARSCNVYFFHYAELVGGKPLVDWAGRLGLGQKTGIDLPGEASGKIPVGAAKQATKAVASNIPRPDALMMAIGQGPITTTPLQIVRAVAAMANGGLLVTPYTAERLITPASAISDAISHQPPEPVRGLNAQNLAVIQKGLRQVVADEQGTAHAVLDLAPVPIAGKTGTAETGGSLPEHAWFAGYAPANDPQVAFVVVIEHGGNSAPATGPIVEYLAMRMEELGYFGNRSQRVAAGIGRGRPQPDMVK